MSHFDPGDLRLEDGDVQLRQLTEGDADGLWSAADEDPTHYGFTHVPASREQTCRYIRLALEAHSRGERYPMLILRNERPMGTTSFLDYQPWRWPAAHAHRQRSTPDTCEIGSTWLAHSAQRTGLNRIVKRMLLGHAFDTWKVHRVTLKTDARNQRSRTAIEGIGARFDGVLRAAAPATDGSVRDSAYYSITAQEWPQVRHQLTAANRR